MWLNPRTGPPQNPQCVWKTYSLQHNSKNQQIKHVKAIFCQWKSWRVSLSSQCAIWITHWDARRCFIITCELSGNEEEMWELSRAEAELEISLEHLLCKHERTMGWQKSCRSHGSRKNCWLSIDFHFSHLQFRLAFCHCQLLIFPMAFLLYYSQGEMTRNHSIFLFLLRASFTNEFFRFSLDCWHCYR